MIPMDYSFHLETGQIENQLIEIARGILSNPLEHYICMKDGGCVKESINKYLLSNNVYPNVIRIPYYTTIDIIYKKEVTPKIESDFAFLNAIITDPNTTISKEYVKWHFIHSISPIQMWNDLDKGSKLNLEAEVTSFSGGIYNYNYNYSATERLEIKFSEAFRFSDYCKRKRLFTEPISGTAYFNLGYANFKTNIITFQSYKDEQETKKFRFVFAFSEYERKQILKNLFLQEVKEFENGLLV